MANRGFISRIPIWVRVPGIIALVLIGVLISTMLLDLESGFGGGHGSGGETEMTDRSGTDRGHGSDDEAEMTDHTGSGDERGSGGDHGTGEGHGIDDEAGDDG